MEVVVFIDQVSTSSHASSARELVQLESMNSGFTTLKFDLYTSFSGQILLYYALGSYGAVIRRD